MFREIRQTHIDTLSDRDQILKCCTSKILIVDDNIFNLIPLEEMLLRNLGESVDKAMNGKEAVDMYITNLNKTCCSVRYELILMDLNMPIMDGYEST